MLFDFISKELLTTGSHIGCSIVNQCLCASNIFVDRETVHVTLKLLNREGVALRQAHQFRKRKYRVKGPNYIEHENDKLNKEVSSDDILVAQDYCQNIFPFR